LDNPGVPPKSIIGTSDFTVRINQQWPIIALTWATCIQYNDTSILAKKQESFENIATEATEIEVYPDNINGEEVFSLTRYWKPLIRTLNDRRKALSRHK
jgi:hypothetical protein